jgi:hypothetical protein
MGSAASGLPQQELLAPFTRIAASPLIWRPSTLVAVMWQAPLPHRSTM